MLSQDHAPRQIPSGDSVKFGEYRLFDVSFADLERGRVGRFEEVTLTPAPNPESSLVLARILKNCTLDGPSQGRP